MFSPSLESEQKNMTKRQETLCLLQNLTREWVLGSSYYSYLSLPHAPPKNHRSYFCRVSTSILRTLLARPVRQLLGAPGIATRSKDATRGSWPYY